MRRNNVIIQWSKTIGSISMQRKKKKNITEMNYKNWLQIILEKRMSRQQQHNCFNKNEIYLHLLKSFLTLAAKNNSIFVPQFIGNKNLLWYRDFLGRCNCKWKMKNASYFPNYDMLIRTLFWQIKIIMILISHINIFHFTI